MIIGKTKTSTC